METGMYWIEMVQNSRSYSWLYCSYDNQVSGFMNEEHLE
jgi:hypothetical protein